MEKYREMYMKEIKEVTEKYKASEQALQNYKSTRRSNLGELQDDADERELLRQQREEVAMLKEQLQDQVELFSEVHTGLFPATLGKGPWPKLGKNDRLNIKNWEK